jgi:hypothetical protein
MDTPPTTEGDADMPVRRLARGRDAATLAGLAQLMNQRGADLAARHLAEHDRTATQAVALTAELTAELVRSFESVRSSWPTHGVGSRVLLRAFFDGYRSAGGPARLAPPR